MNHTPAEILAAAIAYGETLAALDAHVEALMGVTFVDELPPDGRTIGQPDRHERIRAQLDNRPGQWALILPRNGSAGYTGRIAAGEFGYTPAGAYEAVARRAGDRWNIYARRVGTEPTITTTEGTP